VISCPASNLLLFSVMRRALHRGMGNPRRFSTQPTPGGDVVAGVLFISVHIAPDHSSFVARACRHGAYSTGMWRLGLVVSLRICCPIMNNISADALLSVMSTAT